jgi:hypothetical protein
MRIITGIRLKKLDAKREIHQIGRSIHRNTHSEEPLPTPRILACGRVARESAFRATDGNPIDDPRVNTMAETGVPGKVGFSGHAGGSESAALTSTRLKPSGHTSRGARDCLTTVMKWDGEFRE